MKLNVKNPKGKWIGSVILVAALAAVFFYKAKPRAKDESEPIRPVKSVLVGSSRDLPTLCFPGVVAAESQVDLSFEVSGLVTEFPAARGDRVACGQLLAGLDPRDYSNQVKNARADLERAQSSLDRISKALRTQAVSQEDYSKALAERNKAEANLAIQTKALESTKLSAPFDGIVAETYVDNFDNVAAGTAVLRLQDSTHPTFTISIPQEYMVLSSSNKRLKNAEFSLVFDWLPDRVFPLRLKNFAAKSDPVTRTYEVTFYIDETDGVLLLPDISGTVRVKRSVSDDKTSMMMIPSDAVGFQSDGTAFVWGLTALADQAGVYEVHRRSVELGDRAGDMIQVTSGLDAGSRIASAGITVLFEGRKVRLHGNEAAGGTETGE